MCSKLFLSYTFTIIKYYCFKYNLNSIYIELSLLHLLNASSILFYFYFPSISEVTPPNKDINVPTYSIYYYRCYYHHHHRHHY